MSRRSVRKYRDPLELLERIVDKTTLTTQRVTHQHVIEVGKQQLRSTHVDVDGEKRAAVLKALDEAEIRHGRELKAALRRLERELEADKDRAVERQRLYFEDLAHRVATQRDKAEEQRIKELTRKLERENEAALQRQWEECERLREVAVRDACTALRSQLRNDFVLEKEQAVADALAKARDGFKRREAEAAEEMRRLCEREAAEQTARVAKLHAEQIVKEHQKYAFLMRKYEKELEHKEKVENDFQELQTDYQRFMDYTDGKYSSSYMMHLRQHGLGLSNKRVSVVTYEDIRKL